MLTLDPWKTGDRARTRTRLRRAWLFGWAVAFYAMYTTVIGQDWFLPIYFAEGYLGVFKVLLAIHRIFYAQRGGTEELRGVTAMATMYVGATVSGIVLGSYAPVIGERNYCAAQTSATGLPPHVFRCTEVPVAFFAFVGAYWIIGWAVQWYQNRTET
ncbi:MAG: hypothetical protein ABIY52_01535 [Gemmatimonadaceae bacterium]